MAVTLGSATLALLVGGRSSRMGQDKGLLSIKGKPLVIRQILRLQSFFQEIFIICSSEEQRERYEKVLASWTKFLNPVRIVCDESKGERAAYYGLGTALKESQNEKVFVLPVDAVGIDRGLVEKLLASNKFPAAYENHPFPSVWLKEHLSHFPSCEKSILALLGYFSCAWNLPHASEEKLLQVNLNTVEDVKAYFGEPICDAWGRHLNYLRLSLTESCNMACQYCLPKGFPGWENSKFRMPFEQVIKILKVFRNLGFEKVRFTGGEPTLYPKLLCAIEEARSLGYETISLTTNGSFIRDLSILREAGLTHINISLDSICEDTFFKITGYKQVSKILELIDQALRDRMNVRINTVVLRTQNFHELPKLLEWAKSRPLILRFIELMPTDLHRAYFQENFVSNEEVQHIVHSLGYAPSSRFNFHEPAGPAALYDHPQHPCRIGFISPLSCNFCDQCNRLRVTAQGKLRLCLFADQDIALPLEKNIKTIAEEVKAYLLQKQEGHELALRKVGNMQHFRAIGG